VHGLLNKVSLEECSSTPFLVSSTL
jgi:hypothetical protein